MNKRILLPGLIPLFAVRCADIDILHWMGLTIRSSQLPSGEPCHRIIRLHRTEFSFRGTIDMSNADDADGIVRVREQLAGSAALPAHLADLKGQLDRLTASTPTSNFYPAFTNDEHGVAFIQAILMRVADEYDPYLDTVANADDIDDAVVTRVYRDTITEASLPGVIAASRALDRA
jgi:hypothetical protein